MKKVMEERFIISDAITGDEREDISIRPSKLDEFIGQKFLKESLKISIEASKKRREPLDHILLSGPPGLGKTTLAHIIANEVGGTIISSSGPVLEAGNLISILTTLKRGDVLFIDEIHRLKHIVEEILYPVMEDFELDIIIGEGNNSRSKKLRFESFTLIGATTKVGLLESPFRDRFGLSARLNLYSEEELLQVIYRSASIFGIPVTPEAAIEIAKRSRGTPRIANRLLRRVRDYTIVKNTKEVTKEIADIALTALGVDKLGLDEFDRRILKVIAYDFGGGPVGIKTIAISIGEETRTLEEVYEPYLIYMGLIKRTPQGRMTTDKFYKNYSISES